ncbi:patatin-like phospholipase family protein [Luteimonas sp. BDR2-5]|uniref:patatin-like phospholipase family protein n=1 Tax=Proluteimonas luteida TaxID=2878685 RepID=UPI001E4E3754|nr:patatin-like phospholipase family protein [Luteimonas sp. BDR2-5]MCD9029223.1 patatin-like phospholipase family protein [Luteimonas sp. BDR2-5]
MNAAPASAAVQAQVARYPTVALVLQGGGALGGYQCGVYERLHTAGIDPNWFAGISIGAINAAILAGNPPESRVAQLRAFWQLIVEPAGPMAVSALAIRTLVAGLPEHPALLSWARGMSAYSALLQGQRGFFEARTASPFLYGDGSDAATSFYDTTPLRETLLRFVDFDRINDDPDIRLTVGAASVTRGNFRYFDSALETIRVEHILASGALPPAFPAVEIDGEPYWDGGIVSNTPLEYILDCRPHEDTLVFQVDLWSAHGPRPQTMMDVLERMKDVRFSSRTRHGTQMVEMAQKLRTSLKELIARLPDRKLPPHLQEALSPYLDDRVFNIIHLIYQTKPHEQQSKDYAFGQIPLREHWESGVRDMDRTLQHPEYFALPDRAIGSATHDVHRARRRKRADKT